MLLLSPIGRAEMVGHGDQPSGARDSAGADGGQDIARIEQAILQGAVGQILDGFGGLQAVLKRSIAVEKQSCRRGRLRLIHSRTIWKTERLSQVLFR